MNTGKQWLVILAKYVKDTFVWVDFDRQADT